MWPDVIFNDKIIFFRKCVKSCNSTVTGGNFIQMQMCCFSRKLSYIAYCRVAQKCLFSYILNNLSNICTFVVFSSSENVKIRNAVAREK